MANTKNKHSEGWRGDQGSPAKESGQGSGQQTAGTRGQKQVTEKDREHYRKDGQRKKSGTHGGNR